jgi:UDP-N-acetylmuramoyl-L-alanyl-D-glutamate--2,6-diaminopimelate ligase
MTGAGRGAAATVSSDALTVRPAPPRSLEALVGSLAVSELRGDPATVVSDVTFRSEEAVPGALFFCVPGRRADGHAFAHDAVRRGAVAFVVERWLPVDVAQVRVPAVREAMGPMSAAAFGRPSERMRAVGVTGTNGKTTVTYLLEGVLRAAAIRPGVVGTTGARIDGAAVALPRTTPEAPDLQRLLARMVDAGVGGVAIEASSHGLDQHRLDGTRFEVAAFTNLSPEHLDYHGSMEHYFRAKARLFSRALSARGVVDVDSAWGERLADESEAPITTFGTSARAMLRATDVEVASDGVAFTVDGTRVTSPLRGAFNVSNCLAAFAAARELGIDDEAACRGIASVDRVPGRLDPVEEGQPFLVLVDYAHTPDGLDNVLRAARRLAAGRVLVVFGCGGDRDRAKRPLMGRAATSLAELSVITSDNPRSEDPMAIIDEVLAGAREGAGAFAVEPDRRAAIRLALREAAPGDVVLIAGKGHEAVQEIADDVVAFDDRVVASEELRAAGEG